MSEHAGDKEAVEMAKAMSWNEDTSAREIANFLPRKPGERWLDLGFRLLIVALLCGWFSMPRPAADPAPSAAQTSTR
ncbi:hypothetical protein [Bosea sp. (in: a-proteobacteria)]|jgi:hypothetical protein|uniref:hypothetical protein n=1 Tax=Bosea sp. (in: a-proteobacteria) TaxID=1871050 RepID=UPI003565B59E